jgi:hypothetical protein
LSYKLSKSTFVRGLQCEKSLYLYKNHYNLKDPISASKQAVFDQGNEIGLLAQSLFPGGVDASPSNHFNILDSVTKTKEFLSAGETIIYEATFLFNEVLIALDVLVKDNQGWKAYEVKSSTSVSNTHIKDAAIQYYTITNSGLNLKNISIVHINNQYVLNDNIEINQLFTIKSVKEEVLNFLPKITLEISRLKSVLELKTVPKIDIGPYCNKPYECDFKGICWKNIPEYSIFNLSKLKLTKKLEFYNNGVYTIDQINLQETKLTTNQTLQVKTEISKTPCVNKKNIEKFLSSLSYPLCFLDFETINPAIPKYNGTKPYQQVVFQYSLHLKKSKTSSLEHKEYLADPNKDPRTGFIINLINDCGAYGDVLVYNIGFERARLNELAEQFPKFKTQLKSIVERLKDLMIPFQKKWYYTHEMKGSYSIKQVLPALVPELNYDKLNIQSGESSKSIFLSMVNKTFTGNEQLSRNDLLEYCMTDTYAMVEILNKLYYL